MIRHGDSRNSDLLCYRVSATLQRAIARCRGARYWRSVKSLTFPGNLGQLRQHFAPHLRAKFDVLHALGV